MSCHPDSCFALRILAAPLACAVLLPALAPQFVIASEPTGDTTAATEKTHVLFLGLRAGVEHEGAVHAVADFTPGTVHIAAPAGRESVPLHRLDSVRTNYEPRLSAVSLTIANAASERVFSPARDPEFERIRALASQGAGESDAQFRLARAEAKLADARALATGEVNLPVTNPAEAMGRGESIQQQFEAAQEAHALAQQAVVTGIDDYQALADKGRAQTGPGTFDVHTVAFELSSPIPVRGAYALLYSTIRHPDTPGTPMSAVHFSALPEIGPNPRKIRLEQRGLPPGFGLDHYEIHIYAGERELATNLARNRVELTRDDAHRFLVLRHQMAHAEGSHAPQLVPDFLPDDFRQHVPHELWNHPVTFRVDADGRVVSFDLEGTGSSATDAYLGSVVRSACFYPALVAGRPQPSAITVVLGDFVR